MATVALSLVGSVGRRGENKRSDVELVQRLLNQNIQPQLKALSVDGIAGNNTVRAIEWFQKQVVGLNVPDGRVDPNGKTLAAMSKPKPQGVAVVVDSPATPVPGSDPTEISEAVALRMANPSFRLTIGGIWGEVHSGEPWLAPDGSRLVLSASSRGVIYIHASGRIYLQSAQGFVGDVTTYPFIEGARRAKDTLVRIAEHELYFLMGVISATSLVGLVAVTGVSIASFVASNRENFKKWSKMLTVIWTVKSSLQDIAPTLYDKVFNATLFLFVTEVVPKSPGAISSESIAKILGAVVGKLGKTGARGKFTAWTVASTLLQQFAVNCLFALPKAINIAVGEHKESADKLIQSLRSSGVTISAEDAKQILEEIRQHPKEIKGLLDQLLEAAK